MSFKNKIIFNNKSYSNSILYSLFKNNNKYSIKRDISSLNNKSININETVIKTPTTKDPHTDPHPEKPNQLDPKGGIPKKPKKQPDPFPNNPKKPKPGDFPIPDELYPQPI